MFRTEQDEIISKPSGVSFPVSKVTPTPEEISTPLFRKDTDEIIQPVSLRQQNDDVIARNPKGGLLTDEERGQFNSLGGVKTKEGRDYISGIYKQFYPEKTEQEKFENKVNKNIERIKNLKGWQRKEMLAASWMGNLFGLNEYLSRKGYLKGIAEEEKGDTAAMYEGIRRYDSELSLSNPEKGFKMMGEVGKVTTEFSFLPTTIAGKTVTTGGNFALQTALQAPQEKETLTQRAISVGQAYLTGKVLSWVGKVTTPLTKKIVTKFGITKPFAQKLIQTAVETPPVAGGFMALTAIQGGTREQVLETGIQILGFEALGLAQNGLFGEAAKRAMEYNPELAKEVKPEVLEKTIKNLVAKPEAKTVDVMKQNVAKYGKEKLQTDFQDWLKSPEGIAEKQSLGLPEGAKTEQPLLWETFNRGLAGATIENIQNKISAQLDYVKDLRQTVAEPALKELRAKQAQQYKDILETEIAKGTSAEEAQTIALRGLKEQADVPEITPPDLSKPEWDILFNKNLEVHTDTFDVINSRKALADWRSGKILQDSQFKYLADILGNKTATELYYKQGDLKTLNVWDYVKATFQFAKLPFAYDVQFFRQASSFAARHPIKYFKGGIDALRSYVSEGYAERISNAVKRNPLHRDAVEHGMNFLAETPWSTVAGKELAPEQFAMGRPFVQKALKYGLKGTKLQKTLAWPVRGVAKWYLASERSMIASCNSFMQGLWDSQIQHWEKQGITGDQLTTYKKNYADTVNTFLKILRAKTKSGAAIQQAANYVLFSPSMTASRIKRPYVMLANEGSRAYAASLVATEIGKIFLMSALAKTIGELYKDKKGKPSIESSYDPRSTDWGVVKIGVAHSDLGGGDTQYYRTITRLVTGEIKNQAGVIRKVPRLSTLENYAKSRETAIIGIITEIATGRNYQGEKIWETPEWGAFAEEHKGILAKPVAKVGEWLTPTSVDKALFLGARELARAVAPQFLGDIFNAAIDSGWGTILSTQVADTLSANVQIYPESASIQMQKEQEKAAQIEYQKNWDDLGPTQQAKLSRQYPMIQELKQQAKFERSEKDQEIAVKPKQISLSSNTKSLFRKYNVPYPAVSRSIGPRFYLNDERFEMYQDLVKTGIDERIKYLTGTAGWNKSSDTQRQTRLGEEIEQVKEAARNRLLHFIKLEQVK